MGVLSIVMSAIVGVLNPNHLLQQARDLRNIANVRQIGDAFKNYQAQNAKFPPINWPTEWGAAGYFDSSMYNTVYNQYWSIPSDTLLNQKYLKSPLMPINSKDVWSWCNSAYFVRSYGNATNGVTNVSIIICMESWNSTDFANYVSKRAQCIADATATGGFCPMPGCLEDTRATPTSYYCWISDIRNMPPINP